MNTAVSVLTSTELESSWRHQVSHLWTPPGEMAPYGIALSSCLLQVSCRWSPMCWERRGFKGNPWCWGTAELWVCRCDQVSKRFGVDVDGER